MTIKKFYSEYETKTADELEAVLKEMHLIRYLAKFERGLLIKMIEETKKKLENLCTEHPYYPVQRNSFEFNIKACEFELKLAELEQILETKI